MSNVLIGIIGVILFIGLALAGALFLGPRFQQSTNSSKGSAAVQAVSQVSSAANMLNVQSGSTTTPAADVTVQLVTPGYLKSIPSNPVTGGGTAQLVLADGTNTGTTAAAFAAMDLGSAGAGVCAAIAQQSGQPDTDATTGLAALPTRPSGCIKFTGTAKGVVTTAGDYVAFASI